MSETQDTAEELLPFTDLLQGPKYSKGSIFGGFVSGGILSIGKDILTNPSRIISDSFNMLKPSSYAEDNNNDIYNEIYKDGAGAEFLKFRKSLLSLDDKYRIDVINKIKNSGLLELIEQIGGMREFARKRFSSAEALRRICS